MAAPLVHGVLELGGSGKIFQLIGVGPEADVAPLDLEGWSAGAVRGESGCRDPRICLENDRRGGRLVRRVQPVVEAVDGAVNGVLGVGERKPVLYFEDSNGDGRADLRRVVLTVDGGIPPSGQPEPGERRPEPLRPQTNP
jgi:hypothetical protein